jgi:hypothetical protein
LSYVLGVLNRRTGGLAERDEKAAAPITLESLPVVYVDNYHLKKSIPTLILEGTESGARSLGLRENAGNFELYDITGAAARHIIRGTDGFFLNDIAIEKSLPALRLRGTEAGAKDLLIRENAGLIEVYDVAAAAKSRDLDGGCIRAGTASRDIFPANELQWVVDIPILGGALQEVAADAVGTPTFPHTTVKVPAEALKHLKSASLILDFAWAATADGTIQLYDSTAGAVRAETATFTGGEASEWLEVAASGLVAGNTMVIRANVTVAGAAGEKASLYRAILRLVLGVS